MAGDALTAVKATDLVSGLGAIVLGAGLGLLAPETLRAHALPLLLGRLAVHGAGMTLKYRFEHRQGLPLWWERALLRTGWICLAALGIAVVRRLAFP